MDVLDERLHDLVEQLGARSPAPTKVLAAKAQKLRRRRWFARASVAGTLAAVLVVTAAVVLRSGDAVNRIETPGNEPDQTSTTVPAPPSTVDVSTDITTLSPTFDQQVAQLERWYHNWPAEAPGGRPSLAAEFTVCDYRNNPDVSGFQAMGLPALPDVQNLFASYSKLSEPLTEARIVDGCVYRPDRFPGDTPANVPVETPADQLPPYLLCATDEPGPVYTQPSEAANVVLKPAVVLSGTDCAAAGFEDPPADFVADLDRRRHVEIELRAVPEDCPTADDAQRWVEHVTQQELGDAWDASSSGTGQTGTGQCFRPHYVDWANHKVGLLFFNL